MLNSGKKISALRDKKNKYSHSRVVRKKNSERNKKTYPFPPPPLQVKWSVPYTYIKSKAPIILNYQKALIAGFRH